ncbi:hypothetical protein HJA60_004294 [Vibrio vulnificus]|nr:hypothetical protein [Vibrio vulnificus]
MPHEVENTQLEAQADTQGELTVDSLLADFDSSSFESALAQLDANDKAAQEAEEAAAQPESEEENKTSKQDAKAAVGMVQVGFTVSENLISGLTGVDFKYDEASKDGVLEALEPLVEKHGLTWLKWFDKYREEIVFAIAFGGLAFTSWMQLKKATNEKAIQLQHEKQRAQFESIKRKEAELEKAKQALTQAA